MNKTHKWFIKTSTRNCGRCAICKEDRGARPHGPYTEIRRRNDAGGYDIAYLGSTMLFPGAIEMINAHFTSHTPTKTEVINYLYSPLNGGSDEHMA